MIPLAVALTLGVAGWIIYSWTYRSLQAKYSKDLSSLVRSQTDAIRQWSQEMKWTVKLQAKDPTTRAAILEMIELSHRDDYSTERILASNQLTQLRQRLTPICRLRGFIDFVVITPAGVNIAAWLDEPIGQRNLGTRSEFLTRALSGETVVSRPFLASSMLPDTDGVPRPGQPTMFAATPVYDRQGRIAAVLGFRLRPEADFSQIVSSPRIGQTDETYAFDHDGTMISDNRFVEQLRTLGLLADRRDVHAILNIRISDPGGDLTQGFVPISPPELQRLTLAAAAAVLGQHGLNLDGYRNYRGVEVIGSWAWLDDLDFAIVTEIETAEAYRPAMVIQRIFGYLVGYLMLISSVCLLFDVRNKQWVQQLEHEQEFGQDLLDGSSDSILLVNNNGLIQDVNASGQALFGYARQELIGHELSMLVPDINDTDHPGQTTTLTKRSSEPPSAEFQTPQVAIGRHKDNRRLFLQIQIRSLRRQGRQLLSYSIRDISIQKDMEQSIVDADRQYHDFVAAIDDWVWSIDHDGRYTDTNPAIEKILGRNSKDILKHHRYEFLVEHDRDNAMQRLAMCYAQGRGWKGQVYSWLHSNGSIRFLESTAVPTLDSDGQVIGYRGIDRDVTDQKSTEESMLHYAEDLVETRDDLEAQAIHLATKSQHLELVSAAAEAASQAKSTFLANTSHEIRNPMNAILGYTDLLLDSNLSPQQRIDFIHVIRRNGKHLLELINDILDLSKIEAGKMTVERVACHPCRIVAEVLDLMKAKADDKGLDLQTRYEGSIPQTIQTDPTRLRQNFS